MSGGETTEYVSVGEAGRMLHVSPKTIARWADQGRIPCVVTLGGHRRFRVADLERAALRMARPSSGGQLRAT